MPNAFFELRQACLANATRPFLARGGALQRCPRCLLSATCCLCRWRVSVDSAVDIVLLMHRDEVFKPTNTGRLIADVLPRHTFAYEWSRLQPPTALLDLLNDPQRLPLLVFPSEGASDRHFHHPGIDPTGGRRVTLILLDGTWRQASRMFRASAWLHTLALTGLTEVKQAEYRARQAVREGQLATAEAAAAILAAFGEVSAAAMLADYFAVFNEHSVASRMSRTPQLLPAHQRLAQYLDD